MTTSLPQQPQYFRLNPNENASVPTYKLPALTNSTAFRTPEMAFNDLVKKLGVPAKWLSQLISFETAGTWDPKSSNPKSSAKGLIQFMDETAQNMPVPGSKPKRNFKNSQEIIDMYPTFVAQMDGPVTYYFTKMPGNKPPYENEQDLFMAVFYPTYRKVSPDTLLPEKVRNVNEGINTVGDYVNKATKGEFYNGRLIRASLNKPAPTQFSLLKPNSQPYKIEEEKLNIPRDRFIGSNFGGDFDSSSLQIGDLIFLVDPTQISFNTQNGYQYFPTIRTKGNPKLTTEEFVKNFSINLIFPNEDSINYQLLHLYAMFRRTPFVNIRNRDICEFFKEICYGSNESKNDDYNYKWLTVALESIQVQSVEGFPNTLQATITLLPMDHRQFNGGFKALKDFADVTYQQQIIYRDWSSIESEYKSKQKLGIEQGTLTERAIDSVSYPIEYDADFRLSIPFRTYYQSLISGRSSIKDNNGNDIETYLNRQSSDFAKCRGKIKTNLLNHYDSAGNRNPVAFEYSYIDEDKRSFSKKMSNLRLDRQDELVSGLLQTYELTKQPDSVMRSLFSVFANSKTYYNLLKLKFDTLRNTIPDILSRHGITVELDETKEFSKNGWIATIQAVLGGLSAMSGLTEAAGTFKTINKIIAGEATIDSISESAAVAGVNFNSTGTNAVGTFQYGIKQIQDYLDDPTITPEKRKERKIQFTAAMHEIQIEIEKSLGLSENKDDITVMTNVNSANGELFKVTSIPVKTTSIGIDNKKDVITNWSLMFANKFVSIPLQAWEYPQYQHIGCEDPSLSIAITSTSEEPIDLKSQFSTLSEKMHENIKFVNTTAPELSLYLDTRLRVISSPGSIFDVFGIKNLIFESSNTTNIQGKPNAWSTNINFSQSDLTVQDYHTITDIPSNYEMLEVISKLLLRITGTNGVESSKYIQVIKFLDKDGNVLDPSIAELVNLHFIINYKDELNKLVEDARSQNARRLTDIAQAGANRYNEGAALPSGETLKYGAIEAMLLAAFRKPKKIQDHVATAALANELKDLGITIAIDEEATSNLIDIIYTFPEIEKVLKFLISNFNTLLDQKFQSYTQLIQPNIGVIDRFFQNFFKDSAENVNRLPMAIGIGLLFVAIAGVAVTPVTVASVAIIAGGAAFGAADLTGAFKTFVQEGKEMLAGDISSFIVSLQNLTLGSAVQNFASKLVKDPIIFKQFSKLFDEATRKKFEQNSINKGVSCYKDFDLPDLTSFDPEIIVGPDFYLYNNVVLNAEFKEYIAESLKRYAKVGKLSAMICLEESKEYVEEYNNILKEAAEVKNEEVKKAVDKAFRDETIGANDTITIEELLLKLNNTIERFGVVDTEVSPDADGDERLKLIIKDYSKLYNPVDGTSPLSLEEYRSGMMVLESYLGRVVNGIPIQDMDYRKLNLATVAKTRVMLQIYKTYISVDKLISGKISEKTAELDGSETKRVIEAKTAGKMHELLNAFLPVCQGLTTETLKTTGGDLSEKLKKLFEKGGFSKPNDNSVQLPAVYRLESSLYNNIGYYIRLNTAIKDFKSTGGKFDLTNLPELRYLDVWNFRAADENRRKVEILQDFNKNSQSLKRDTTIKLFPTFKIFFVQENKNFMEVPFDNYFSQDAINSIEVITNKNSASKTAIIKFSNIVGSLTDQASLLRESVDFNGKSIIPPKQFFLGTLDIKPGTMIIIKVGYGPYDKLLHTVFNGRVIEMNPGPIVEMVCQSFGAQLNHYIPAEKFGFWSSVREYGDIASSLLDSIPGLEKLGKPVPFGIVSTSDFTGKNLRNIRGKLGENFLMSNIIGSLNSILMAQDNPRDENIYLDYSILNTIWHHPTFDWVVAEQSVWEALKELSLYHKDTIVTVRPFNDDSVSGYGDLRETLVIGKKTGYYKYTDSYSLSSLNIKEIDQVAADWDNIKSKLPTLNDIGASDADKGRGEITLMEYQINERGKTLYKYLQKPINALVLVSYLIKHHKRIPAGQTIGEMISQLLSNNRVVQDDFDKLLANIITFSRSNFADIETLLSPNGVTIKYEENQNFEPFYSILLLLKSQNIDLSAINIIKEESYNVKVIVDNVSDQFVNDPQYKRIQSHHLVTDNTDIISNNISLNGSFNNMVNLYYTNGEPSLATSNVNKFDDDFIKDKLNVWSVKAFGEQRDEFCRPLNSYQKNIDTNWFDVAERTGQFFETFKKVNKKFITGTSNGLDKEVFGTLCAENNNNIGSLPYWNILPSFVTVGASLLKQEVEKMYQGTIEIVGNPFIKPMDILHIQDYTNDMHGAVEVEEVIHTFTPDRGFRTVITPNLITYDREPIKLQDVQIIDQIYSYAGDIARIRFGMNAVAAGGAMLLAARLSPAITPLGAIIGGGIAGAGFLYNGTIGNYKKYHKFLYEKMGNILGRDCINFTTLLYHGLPFMAGFDGVDYTSLKTLMNYNVAGIQNPISRYFAYKNTFAANMLTGMNPEDLTITQGIFGRLAGDNQ